MYYESVTNCVLRISRSCMRHFGLAYGGNHFRSIRCHCVSIASQNLPDEMGTEGYAHSIMVYSDSWCYFILHHFASFLFLHIRRIWNVCLQLFKYFRFSLPGSGISTPPKTDKKAAKSSNIFFKTHPSHGGPCCLHTSYSNRSFHRLLDSPYVCLCTW